MSYEYLLSACLTGQKCKYNGGSNPNKLAQALFIQGRALPVCPETLAGLPCPREPVEQKNGRLISKSGVDLTQKFVLGAEKALTIAKASGAKKAILKARSPSCGYGRIYDGTFSGNLREGNGVWTQKLIEAGFEIFTEENLPQENSKQ